MYNFDVVDLGKNIIELDESLENVIYLNSLSKVFFPGIRIGFLVSNPKILEQISDIQKYTTSSPNLIMQGVAIKALQNGGIDSSIKHYFSSIGNKKSQLLNGFEKYGLLDNDSPIDLIDSKGGFYYWGKFKDNNINTKNQLQNAYNMGISYIPGEIYYKNKDISSAFRLACAQISSDDIQEATRRFSEFVYSITTK